VTKPPSIEELAALKKAFEAAQSALDTAQSERDAIQCDHDVAQAERNSLIGENRILRAQRDLPYIPQVDRPISVQFRCQHFFKFSVERWRR
jgi:hypothetical protein